MLKNKRGVSACSLSSCRIRAEALARAFNSRIWPCTWVDRGASNDKDSLSNGVSADDDEEFFDASPSPIEDEEESLYSRYGDSSAATEAGRTKLFELLQQHASDDATDVFYDVSEDAGLSENVNHIADETCLKDENFGEQSTNENFLESTKTDDEEINSSSTSLSAETVESKIIRNSPSVNHSDGNQIITNSAAIINNHSDIAVRTACSINDSSFNFEEDKNVSNAIPVSEVGDCYIKELSNFDIENPNIQGKDLLVTQPKCEELSSGTDINLDYNNAESFRTEERQHEDSPDDETIEINLNEKFISLRKIDSEIKVTKHDAVTESSEYSETEENSEPNEVAIKIIDELNDFPSEKEYELPTLSPGTERSNRLQVFDECRPKISRSTSLKTGKTPPGTPSRKKIVRFADVLGLDLEDVRHIMTTDVPIIPSSAYTDLDLKDEDLPAISPVSETVEIQGRQPDSWETVQVSASPNVLCAMFPNPGQQSDFMDRVRNQGICLESVIISDMSVQCTCRVMNWGYKKRVVARYTVNEWASSNDIDASYVPGSSQGETDSFVFNIFLSPLVKKVQFAIRYVVSNKEFWDNNKGMNYSLGQHGNNSIIPASSPPWLHQFW
ncbi:CBM21 domain-containing protein, partial [Stegodyphus mimosarum]